MKSFPLVYGLTLVKGSLLHPCGEKCQCVFLAGRASPIDWTPVLLSSQQGLSCTSVLHTALEEQDEASGSQPLTEGHGAAISAHCWRQRGGEQAELTAASPTVYSELSHVMGS